MKIRRDFVTNSSSSSFILSFKDEKSVESTLTEQFPKDIKEGWSAGKEGYLQQLLDEIKDARRYTKEDIASLIEYENEYEIKWRIQKKLYIQSGMTCKESEQYLQTLEGRALIQKEINKQVKDALEKIGDDQVIVEVEHGDGGEGEDGILEHIILPSLDCTVCCFSHH